jgi:S-adenosylmethionine:tRNA ribosyltransferase-isomerase
MWLVEVRRPDGVASAPFPYSVAGETLGLPGGAHVTLHAPYQGGDVPAPPSPSTPRFLSVSKGRAGVGIPPASPVRLWIATLELGERFERYLERYGFPIRYGYVRRRWPASYYQTVYATELGSAEMPSAGRAFTPELITQLVARGVQFAPLLLHTGVASLEDHEPPYEEFYRVPLETARLVNAARAAGKRVIAVGTTAVRALESVTDAAGSAHPGEGWTRLVITPQRGIRAVDALLTGLHEPRASHLAMLEALAGIEHLRVSYGEALRERYLWHEFGDLHLIMP